MPPPTTTCAVCHENVPKSTTLARGDGTRACKSHDGVVADAEARKRQEQERLKMATDPDRRQRWGPHSPPTTSVEEEERNRKFRDLVNNHCWVCGQDGVSLRDYLLKCLVAMKRLEIRGEFNFLTLPDDVRKLLPGERALAVIQLGDEVIDKAVVKHVRDRHIRDLIPLLKHVQFCAECAVKHGFRARWEALLPRPTYEDVVAFAPVMEAFVEPVIRAEAERKERQS